jgi:hypothetical protein
LMNLHKALTLDQLAMIGNLNMEVKLKTDL